MFKKILIANRGEIARRIIKTCREMDIATVAVYSTVDQKALHVLEAEQALAIGEAEPSASYLNIDSIIAVAKQSNAEAIHPGYGFLSENAEFAARCLAEGIVFIGPPTEVIRNLGNKIKAREIMQAGGVPVIPGLAQLEIDQKKMAKAAAEIGYPVMIKAAAGGGGKGIRIVYSPDQLENACLAASREAKAAFGESAIYLEKYFEKARHVEFQILADAHGNTIHLLERECSIQRRHQKIIEETPSPAVDAALRERMGNAAVTAAKASGYVNAGTVEFLLDQEENFYFLEVNTRLQVEHPITEMVTGIDLVRQQILIAAGEKLSIRQQDVQGRGHALECRIYAEDPENDFYPSPGKIVFMQEPTGPGLRNDCGVYSGVEVPVEYDPIISKLVTHAESRDLNLKRMVQALRQYVLLGIKTPIPFLIDLLESEPFRRGETYTSFIQEHFSTWAPKNQEADIARLVYLIDELHSQRRRRDIATESPEIPSPFSTLGNWRLDTPQKT